jgi:hypothetical protein
MARSRTSLIRSTSVLATHGESKCPIRPRAGRNITRHGALIGKGITAANAAVSRNRGFSIMVDCATADNWPDSLRRAIGEARSD